MKRTAAILLLLPMAFGGCSASGSAVNSAETAQTEPATADTSTAASTSDILPFEYATVYYDDYESFRTAFGEIYPEMELYCPPEDSGFVADHVSACESNYMLSLKRGDGGKGYGLEIDYASHYDTIEDYYAMFTGSYTLGNPKFEIITDRYLLEHYPNGKVVMYGITGEDNTAFALIAEDDTPEGIAVLEEAYRKLGL